MSNEIHQVDLTEAKKDIKAAIMAEMKAEADAKAAQEAAIKEAVDAALEKQEAEYQEELKAAAEKKSAPAFNETVGKNSKSEGADEFLNWMRTGDGGAEKVLKRDEKALQIGSDTEGGYLVPEDFYARIIEKRDQMAWTRNVGMQIVKTNLTNVQFPTEATAMGKFEIAAEEAGYSDSDPVFGEVDVQVYKYTRMNKMSKELLADQAANLEEWYSNSLARAMALTESNAVAVGTGSSQPQGVFVGGTAGLTFDSADNITADEIPELFYKLGNGYRSNATWLMNDATEGYLRKIRDANNWAFDPTGALMGVSGDWKYNTFFGNRPVYTEGGIGTIATGIKTILVGDFSFYGLVERQGLEVARNPYLYQANGQVGFFADFRIGGSVLQAEAFQYGTQA